MERTPLHKTVHWRRLKEIIKEICDYEQINTSDYNFDKICCYRTHGSNLKGKNVTYGITSNASCWVTDNEYEFFEVPAYKNKSKYKIAGEFLFLAHNTDFDYWIFRNYDS